MDESEGEIVRERESDSLTEKDSVPFS